MKTHLNSIAAAPRRSTLTWPGLILAAWLTAQLLTLTSCAAFKRKVILIPADYTEQIIPPGATITVTNGGVLLGTARYREYRRAVADRILEERGK